IGKSALQVRVLGRSWDSRKVPVLAEIRHDAAGREDLLREFGDRPKPRITVRRPQDSGAEVERHLVPVARERDGILRFEHRYAEVDAVAEEDPREALRDDAADAELLERRHRVLPR